MPESSLEACYSKHFAIPLDPILAGIDYLSGFVLALMVKVRPNISQLEANLGFRNKELIEGGPDHEGLPFDKDLLTELIHPNDARTVNTWHAERDLEGWTRQVNRSVQKDMVRMKVKQPVPKGAAKPPKAKDIVKWKPPLAADANTALTFIQSHAPPKEYMRIAADTSYGRFRLLCPLDRWEKTVSWTQRGWDKSATEVLYQAWTHYTDITGFDGPPNLSKLPAVFA